MNIGIISGYFSPVHLGHIEYINYSKKECEYLIAIINNDYQVKLKGTIPFMDEFHRSKIINNLKSVDEIFISIDTDKTVCNSLRKLREKYPNDNLMFFNSGDRTIDNLEISESKVCEELKIKEVVIHLPKLYSSSELLKNAINYYEKRFD